MMSRSRSISRVAAMSIDRTTSANSTVTCLYSAERVDCVSRPPHSVQNLPVELECAPQEPQTSGVAVGPPPTSWLAPMSLIVSPLVSDVWHIAAIGTDWTARYAPAHPVSPWHCGGEGFRILFCSTNFGRI